MLWQIHTRIPDYKQWNQCISTWPFLRAEYLPFWNCNWMFYTLDNPCRAIFALPFRHKWGIFYAFQPPLLPWLEVQGQYSPEEKIALQKIILKQFPVVHILINDAEKWPDQIRRGAIQVKYLPADKNELPLSWSRELKKNLHKTRHTKMYIQQGNVATAVTLFNEIHGHHHPPLSYSQLQLLAEAMIAGGFATAWETVDSEGTLLASLILVDNGKELFYWLGAPTVAGREKRALHRTLADLMILHCGQRQSLNFMGSDIPEVARFYHQFLPETVYTQEIYASRGLAGKMHKWWLNFRKR